MITCSNPNCEARGDRFLPNRHFENSPECWIYEQKLLAASFAEQLVDVTCHPVYQFECGVCGATAYSFYGKSMYCAPCRYKACLRQRRKGLTELVCIRCGEKFMAKRIDAGYCSSKCRQAAYRQRGQPDVLAMPMASGRATKSSAF
jgi:hypothetical protein